MPHGPNVGEKCVPSLTGLVPGFRFYPGLTSGPSYIQPLSGLGSGGFRLRRLQSSVLTRLSRSGYTIVAAFEAERHSSLRRALWRVVANFR